ncbi:MAG: hypothetical protein M0T70_11505 [Geobacteraceae bacterium]|nr:hypothetical protein [Geobacteraceae bacterium]
MNKPFYYFGWPDPIRGDLLYGDPKWGIKYHDPGWANGMTYHRFSRNCSLNPDHTDYKRSSPLAITLASLKIGDIMWCGDCIVTDRVKDIFVRERFTGVKFEEVIIGKVKRMPKEPVELPRLWELVVIGSGGEAHPASGIKVYEKCPECGFERHSSFRNGLIVEENNWDGSDFFYLKGYPTFILVTERVKDVIVSNKITNCGIFAVESVRWASGVRPEDLVPSDGIAES